MPKSTQVRVVQMIYNKYNDVIMSNSLSMRGHLRNSAIAHCKN